MKAVQFLAVNEVTVRTVEDPVPGKGEALIKIKAAALNHRDLWIKLGKYPGLKWPVIPGSDGAGEVVAIGGDNPGFAVGDEVLINPAIGWGDDQRAQADTFTILGLPRNGTLAEYVTVPVTQLSPKPKHLSWAGAAALPLAGLTAYRVLFSRAKLQAGEKVLISGVGGGVALFAMQFAVALGAKVWVTSSSAEKVDRAVSLGAEGGFLYSEKGWSRRAKEEVGGFDVIVDSAGGEGFERLIDVAATGGRVVFFGATLGDPSSLPMRKVFWKQLSLLGTTMGSPADWQAMVDFVALHKIDPIVSEIFNLADAHAAFDLMQAGRQFGKIVVRI
jgi:zinc-binding alcohol dehydrogenase/oxidoreductase